jgi:hypothetical protein
MTTKADKEVRKLCTTKGRIDVKINARQYGVGAPGGFQRGYLSNWKRGLVDWVLILS